MAAVRFNRLSHQILLVFLLVVIVSLGVSGWFVMKISENIVTRKISEGDQNFAGRIAQEVAAEMATVKPTLTLLAESTGLRLMEATEVKDEIDRVQRSFPEITSIYVADMEGEQIARTGTGKLENVSRIWSFQVARGGDELVSDIYLKPMTSEPVQTITLPIIDNGTVIGVLSADVSFRRIMVSVMGIYIGKDGNVVVIADNGRVVAHTRMKQVPELDLTRLPVVEAVLAGEEGAMKDYTDELGRQVLGSYVPIKELGWGVLIQRPLADIDAEVGQIRTTIILVTIAAVLLAVLAGWLMSRQIAKPIGQLASASERVAQGDLSTLVDVKSSNEVGALAHSFNQMIVSLKESRDELQQWSEALRESEKKYRTILDDIEDGYFEVDIAGNFTFFNDSMCGIIGYSRDEMMGMNNRQFMDKENAKKVFQAFNRVYTTGKPTKGFGWEIIRKDGARGFIEASISPMRSSEGEPIGFRGIVRDIIERKRAEEELKRHREHLEELVKERTAQLRAANEEVQQRADELTALYEVSRDLAAALNLEVLLPVIAQRLTDTLGADRCTVFLFDERAGLLRARAAHGYMAERLADFSYQPGEEIAGQAYATEKTQYVPDLDLVPDLPRRDEIRAVLAIPLASPTAGPLGVLSVTSLQPEAFTPDQQQLLETLAGQIARAIENARLYQETERHAADLAALYEVGKEITSTLELDTMLQTIADDAARMVGADKSLILLIDAEEEKLTRAMGHGYSRAQLDGHTFEEFQDGISGWVLQKKVPTLSADIQTDERNRGKALTSARRSRDRSAAIAPLAIGDKMMGTLTVVNSRQEAVFTPADLSLVTMLAGQASIAIQNARLYEATQEADRLKSQFLANMSHELRTPLNSIIGYTKLMLDGLEGPINEEQREDLRIVYTNSKHLLQLINDLLDLSRIEAGKIVLSYQTFTISELLAEVIPGIEQLVREKGIALVTSVDPSIDYLYADKGKTRQVLINILGNAVKFTNEGSIELNVAETDTDFVFSATDTGIGIKKEHLEVIFDRFEQVGPAQIAGYEGTGLGLTISKQFVEMQGGRIWAESEPGKGSTFSFTLPKKRVTGP